MHVFVRENCLALYVGQSMKNHYAVIESRIGKAVLSDSTKLREGEAL